MANRKEITIITNTIQNFLSALSKDIDITKGFIVKEVNPTYD